MPESAKIYPNVGKYTSIILTLWIWLNTPEISRASISRDPN